MTAGAAVQRPGMRGIVNRIANSVRIDGNLESISAGIRSFVGPRRPKLRTDLRELFNPAGKRLDLAAADKEERQMAADWLLFLIIYFIEIKMAE